MKKNFRGIATAYNVVCSDGLQLADGAFEHQDGQTVPLVFQHNHNDINQVLGHAVLESDPENGVMYADCYLNESESAKNAAESVKHGDINALSIFANNLKFSGGNTVTHGDIKEVSLVLSGANEGAKILSNTIAHADGTMSEDYSKCIIHSGFTNEDMGEGWDSGLYDDDDPITEGGDEDVDIEAIYNAMTDEQKIAVGAIAQTISEELSHSDLKGGNEMKHGNLFTQEQDNKEVANTISHSDLVLIGDNAKSMGSLRKAVSAYATDHPEAKGITELKHAGTYGIDNIEYLYPDFKEINDTPDFIKRKTDWVEGILQGVHTRPFSKLKMTHADITADEARAKGYTKGNKKIEEVFELLRRTVEPTWIYKKQKLDQEEIISITDFNVVNWLWSEMDIMLREEIARSFIFGDGRAKLIAGEPNKDKINESKIIPIVADDDLYCIKVYEEGLTPELATAAQLQAFIESVALSMEGYKGTGTPTLYCRNGLVNLMKIKIKDNFGQFLYKSKAELIAIMGVKDIVEIECFGRVNEDEDYKDTLLGVIVNIYDYSVGVDKGGKITKFSDFDIDYNQHKYLMETYISGALDKPYSAITIWAREEVEDTTTQN